MFEPVQFPSLIEPLVRFVEETPREKIVEETIGKLRSGVTAKEMLTASALAVTRSTDIAVGHHGGPCHALCGVYPSHQTAARLSGDWAFMPVVQHVALSNEHIHCPEYGPYILPEVTPIRAVDMFNLQQRGYYQASEGTLEETRDNFMHMMQIKHPPAAEGHLAYLMGRIPNDEILDLILTKAIPFNPNDDHYFLFPVYSARALDVVGWEWGSVLLRPSVRWQSRNPYMRNVIPPSRLAITYPDIEQMLDEYQLLEINIPSQSTAGETDAIGKFADQVGHCDDFSLIPQLTALALAEGLSIEGTAEALSIASATTFLRTSYGNPMDSHLHTGINARRYAVAKNHISLKNKVLSLLTAYTGPEIALSMPTLDYAATCERATMDALPDRDQPALIDAIVQTLMDIPTERNLHYLNLTSLRTFPGVRDAMALAQQYAEKRFDPMSLFIELAKLTTRDDFTEMHAIKHHQAAVDEYYTCREPFRWVHLVSAVKYIGFSRGAKEQYFAEARDVLRV